MPTSLHRAQPTLPQCPICGAKATDSTRNTNAMGVVTAAHVDAHEHLWEVRYVAINWPAAS